MLQSHEIFLQTVRPFQLFLNCHSQYFFFFRLNQCNQMRQFTTDGCYSQAKDKSYIVNSSEDFNTEDRNFKIVCIYLKIVRKKAQEKRNTINKKNRKKCGKRGILVLFTHFFQTTGQEKKVSTWKNAQFLINFYKFPQRFEF